MKKTDEEVLFDAVVSRHAPLDTMGLAIARALARELSGDSVSPAAVTALTALLPEPKPLPHADLSKLSDTQLLELDALMAVATSSAPSEPLPPEQPPSPRTLQAIEMARLLDIVEHRGDELSPHELTELRNHLVSLTYPVITIARLVEPYAGAIPAAPPAEPVPEPTEPASPPAAKPSNVVDIRGNGSCAVSGSLADRYPSLRWDPPVGKW
jgi:hypothetical protein